MRISFIITYYNEPAELLRGCVDSILTLPLGDGEREIIVVDDGGKIPAEQSLTGKGVRCIRQENGGLSRARNRGLEAAQGDYVQFVDADDALILPSYSAVIRALRSQSPDMVLFRFSDREDRGANPPGTAMKRTDGATYLRRHNIRGSACCYVFRRGILGGLRFEPGILHEDELFTPQLLMRAGLLLHTTAAAYLYRQRTSTIMHSHDSAHTARRVRDAQRVIAELKAMSDGMGGASPLRRRVAQLTMDHIYNVWNLTRDPGTVLRTTAALRGMGLFPLPLRPYTAKYLAFALATWPMALYSILSSPKNSGR